MAPPLDESKLLLSRTLLTSLDEALRPCAPSVAGRTDDWPEWLDAWDSARARGTGEAEPGGGTGDDLAELRAEAEEDLVWVALLMVDELAWAEWVW